MHWNLCVGKNESFLHMAQIASVHVCSVIDISGLVFDQQRFIFGGYIKQSLEPSSRYHLASRSNYLAAV
jgi:hypothetical protein